MSDVATWRASQRGLCAAMATTSEDGECWELGAGVTATAMPVAPDRSIFNAVVADDARALAAALPVAGDRYAALGVRAWTVWTGPDVPACADVCLAAGHVLDGTPEVMAARYDELDLELRGVGELARPDFGRLAAINDAAYGVPPHLSFGPVLCRLPADGPLRCTLLRDGGEVVAGAATMVVDGDCYVALVAVVPEARGRGLGGEVVRQALRAARDEAGARTTTLEATALGAPVYARLGYRRLGAAGMWERRTFRAAPGS